MYIQNADERNVYTKSTIKRPSPPRTGDDGRKHSWLGKSEDVAVAVVVLLLVVENSYDEILIGEVARLGRIDGLHCNFHTHASPA